ncbi:MAG TPA: hypothetical protein VFX55_09705 [Duganella sp.]|nr:hypothetical protein [Duganella sp.]
MSAFLFLLNILATLCFARNGLELNHEGREFVKRIDELTSAAFDAASRQSVRGILGGLAIFTGLIAVESLTFVVLDLYLPMKNEAWKTYWLTMFLYSAGAGIAITWITKPSLLNQPMLGFSIWFPLTVFLLPLLDVLAGGTESLRVLSRITEFYQPLGVSLPANAWAYAAALAIPMMLVYVVVWFFMTIFAWIVVAPMALVAYFSVKAAAMSSRFFPKAGLTPICFLLIAVTAAYSWSW